MPDEYRPRSSRSNSGRPHTSRAERRAQQAATGNGLRQRWRRRRASKKRRIAAMSRQRRIWRRVGLVATWLLGVFAMMLGAAAILLYSVSHVPSPDELVTNQNASVLYADGSPMATVTGDENRVLVSLPQVPEQVRNAVLAAEDRKFYSESGVSIKGTLRAAISDLTGGSTQGGSTITQQYVKNAYLNSDQTLSRKLKELAISLKLSRTTSKDKILEGYLNTIYFGRGAYGIEAASQAYFGVPVGQLTVSQGALLAAVIKSPEYYDPAVTPSAAQGRWTYVVDGMVTTGKLTQADRNALTFPTTIGKKAESSVLSGPLGLVWTQVKKELSADGIDPAAINAKGLTIQTTIDPKAQAAATTAVTQTFANLSALQKSQGVRPALTAVDPATGAVIAYYGGPTGTDFDFANGYRPPGSSFKPYTLATALSQNLAGVKPAYSISSVFDGSYCVTIDGTKICNDPSDAQYSGMQTLAYAMKVSLNTTFDGLAFKVGPSNVATTAHAMGIAKTRSDNGGPTLVNSSGQTTFGIGIGDSAYSVRPLDQAVGFATIANGGISRSAYFVQKVTDAKGNVLFTHKVAGTRVLDAKVANDLSLTLQPIASWSGVALANGRLSGSKTGTAGIDAAPGVPANYVGQNSDAWMVGYTPQVSAAVWVGTDGSRPISNGSGTVVGSSNQEYGRDLPGRTWKLFMDTYLANQPKMAMATSQQITTGTNQETSAPPSSSAPASSSAPSSSTPASSSAVPSTTPPTSPPTSPVIPPTSPVIPTSSPSANPSVSKSP